MNPSGGHEPVARLDFRSGGWILLVAGVLMAAIAAWRVSVWVMTSPSDAPGDGRTVASYGFSLGNCTVSRDALVAAGFPKDGVVALSEPEMLTVEASRTFHAELRKNFHHKFIVPSDPVVGVEVGGEARAYPLRLLAWHQIVNDTIADTPIVVTYDPLCDSTAVFDRRVAGEVMTFGVSGLVWNGNLLMYDRRPVPDQESLWSQILAAPIAGPAVDEQRRLEVVPATVMPWGEWSQRHPQTRVMKLDVQRVQLYKRTFAQYYGHDDLMFPVANRLDPGQVNKRRVLGFRRRGDHPSRTGYIPIEVLLDRAEQGVSPLTIQVEDQRITLAVDVDARRAWPVGELSDGLECIPCFHFIWRATYPDSEAIDG